MSPHAAPCPPGTVEEALALGYAHLNRRERTIQEMRAHLLARGAGAEVVEAALEELSSQGYLDDDRFAKLFVQDKRHLDGWGNRRILESLLERGISRERAEVALNDLPEGELERALDLLHQRFPDGLPSRRESDRALGMLVRKGYDYDLAVDALAAHRRQGRCSA